MEQVAAKTREKISRYTRYKQSMSKEHCIVHLLSINYLRR